MKNMEITRKDIEEEYGLCHWCEKNLPQYVCDECNFSVCIGCSKDEPIIEDGKCPSACYRDTPDLIDLDSFPDQNDEPEK